MTDDDDQLLTYDQAAERLSVSVSTVKRLIAAGELPRVQLGPNSPRIAAADVRSFIDRMKSHGNDGGKPSRTKKGTETAARPKRVKKRNRQTA